MTSTLELGLIAVGAVNGKKKVKIVGKIELANKRS